MEDGMSRTHNYARPNPYTGCHRCRILGTTCSLKQQPLDSLTGGEAYRERSESRDADGSNRNGKRPAEQEEMGEWYRARLEELESRLQVVETQLESTRRRSFSPARRPRVPYSSGPVTSSGGGYDESVGHAMIKHPAPYTAIPDLLGVEFGAGWYGPVRSGLVSEGQMGGAYLWSVLVSVSSSCRRTNAHTQF